ncbi:MAG: fumarylacetoacetate hydrolase family protein [Pyrinomonadaceae bacterium]|nr:fumarylacetoacetate hydrolase family protein [Pyrinomonadaceae bacterium]
MKLISYQRDGRNSYGVVVNNRIVEVGGDLGSRYPTLRAVLENDALSELARYTEGDGKSSEQELGDELNKITVLPVIPNPDKIICVGLNYAAHRAETGRGETDHPTLFTRFANTLVGHNQPIIKPKASEQTDYEAELAVIIGKRARHVSVAEALSYVGGYACFNDVSIRDWQHHTSQFTPGKNFPGTGSLGPWLVTADEIADPSKLTLMTRLNGEELQNATTDQMIFTIPDLISYISTFTELVPGDIIATGTPSGVGVARKPPLFMKPGDMVEVEVSGIGVLRNPVVAE